MVIIQSHVSYFTTILYDFHLYVDDKDIENEKFEFDDMNKFWLLLVSYIFPSSFFLYDSLYECLELICVQVFFYSSLKYLVATNEFN